MKVTVVIPTYNRRALLQNAVDSALNQVGVETDVVVVDDASTDGTVPWLQAHYAGQAVQVLPNAGRKGPAGGRNTGLKAARGELVALLDSDDVFLPGHLADACSAFARFPDLDVLFGRARYVRNGQFDDYMGPNFERKLALAPTRFGDEAVVVFESTFFEHLIEYGCWFNLSTVVMRQAVALARMDESLRVAEDYEFWVRLAQTHRFGCLQRHQIRYLLHDNNISFETSGSAALNAPSLLTAYRAMLNLPGINPRQQRLVKRQMSEVMGDWAWRCRQQGRLGEAASLHLKALPLGSRRAHLWGLLKLAALKSGLRPESASAGNVAGDR